jgi:hypothetical protein
MLSQLSYSPTSDANYRWAAGLSKGWEASAGGAAGRFWGPAEAWYPAAPRAGVAKLVYAGDSKSPGFTAVRVRLPPPAPPIYTRQ